MIRRPGRPRLVHVVTHPWSARLLLAGQLAYMREHGLDVTVISGPGGDLGEVAAREEVAVRAVPLRREIDPLHDLAALVRLSSALRSISPDIVNASTPKAAFVGLVAAAATGVPVRVYVQRGLRAETLRGVRRPLVALLERASVACAHRVCCVSESLRRRLIDLRLAPQAKTVVLASGSSNGVDAARFRVTAALREEGRRLRETLGIPPSAPVIGFVGRLTRDKGVAELVRAFAVVRAALPGSCLLLVGDLEPGDPLPADAIRRIGHEPGVVLAGRVADPAPFYSLMDVLALPSYREGFPNAPLEAAAAELPVVAFRSTGTVDAVADGTTGTLVPPGDVRALAAALARYLGDAELCRLHGAAGRRRVLREFRPEAVWAALLEEYSRLLGAKGLPLPAGAPGGCSGRSSGLASPGNVPR